MPLLWYLRDELGLTGTKFGCGIGLCGACTVHLDGDAVRSCVTPMRGGRRQGHHHRGARAGRQAPVQVAWREHNVPQCGYCQAGQIMQAAALLKDTPKPTDERHRQRHERQHLPLRHLYAHPRRHQAGREGSPAIDANARRFVLANVSRRSFLGGVARRLALVLAVALPGAGRAPQEKKFGADGMPQGWRDDPRVFVAIAPDGTVTVTCHRSEMGQGVRTSVAMVVADELEADWTKVRSRRRRATKRVRQPGHRRLALAAPLLHALAPRAAPPRA